MVSFTAITWLDGVPVPRAEMYGVIRVTMRPKRPLPTVGLQAGKKQQQSGGGVGDYVGQILMRKKRESPHGGNV